MFVENVSDSCAKISTVLMFKVVYANLVHEQDTMNEILCLIMNANETSGSTKGGKFIDQLRDWLLGSQKEHYSME